MAINISVPSTVTLEALDFGKSVVNIGFDSEQRLSVHKSVKRFWDAPFYRRFLGDDRVLMTQSVDQIQKQLKEIVDRYRVGTVPDDRSLAFIADLTPAHKAGE